MASKKRLLAELSQQRRAQRGGSGGSGGGGGGGDNGAPEFMLDLVSDDNLFEWRCTMRGPPGSPYVGGTFVVDITVPPEYPYKPPAASFRTKVFHPNIHWKTGEVCLDLLKSSWSAVCNVATVCTTIRLLLQSPNGDSPLNTDSGALVRSGDMKAFWSMAQMYTRIYAVQSAPTAAGGSVAR